jgi:Flp pilus assembly protein TadD
LSRALTFAATALLLGLLPAGCGGSSSTGIATRPNTTTAPSAPSTIRGQLSEAAAIYNAGAATFNTRSKVDAKAGNLQAFKADVAQFRAALFEFDAAVRAINFPHVDQQLAKAQFAADRYELADLDAIFRTASGTGTVRLYKRAIADNRAVISAEQALYGSS